MAWKSNGNAEKKREKKPAKKPARKAARKPARKAPVRERASRAKYDGPSVSVVIPVYNEKDTAAGLLTAVEATGIPEEIIVVDDCSTDGTREILEGYVGRKPYRVVFKESNGGKGSALRRGFEQATGDIIIIQDADLEYNPAEYGSLLQPIIDGKADVVYGSRLTGAGAHRVLYFWHALGNRMLTALSNMTTDLNLTDMETCYKAFRRELLSKVELRSNRFGIEPELTAKFARAKARVYEVPISYDGRTYAEGKKIGWLDGLAAIWWILRFAVAD